MVIRQISPQESEIICRLQQQNFNYVWPLADWIQALSTPGTICKMAYQKEKPIAYLVTRHDGQTADVISLAVLPSYRRQGVAKALITDMIKNLPFYGVRKIFLEVSCYNKAARTLYEYLGFEAVSVRPNYYHQPPHPPEDAIVMELYLLPNN